MKTFSTLTMFCLLTLKVCVSQPASCKRLNNQDYNHRASRTLNRFESGASYQNRMSKI